MDNNNTKSSEKSYCVRKNFVLDTIKGKIMNKIKALDLKRTFHDCSSSR